MIDIVEKGSYRVAVHEPVDAEQLEPQQVLALCAAGARNGSGDPIDLALVHSATSRGQAIPFEQGSWSGPSPERRYSLVQLRRVIDDCELRVARGDLDSILALTVASDQRRERSHQALASLETEGFVGIGVAVAENTGGWRFAGIVPVRVTRARTSMKDSPTDFLYIQVWDWQLRVLHWTWVILIAVLAVTGLMISEGWVPWYGDRDTRIRLGPPDSLHRGLVARGGPPPARGWLFLWFEPVPAVERAGPSLRAKLEGRFDDGQELSAHAVLEESALHRTQPAPAIYLYRDPSAHCGHGGDGFCYVRAVRSAPLVLPMVHVAQPSDRQHQCPLTPRHRHVDSAAFHSGPYLPFHSGGQRRSRRVHQLDDFRRPVDP